MLNLEPATMILANIVKSVGDDQLDVPTPCAGATLGELLDHVNGFAWVFTAAANKARWTPVARHPSRMRPTWRGTGALGFLTA